MIELIVFLILLLLGYFVGQSREQRHLKEIREREQTLGHVLTFSARFPPERIPAPESFLVCGNVVISIDYFKRFLAGLRYLVGGRVSSYETLLDRGRREALLRMKQAALAQGAQEIFCVRLETASISNNAQGGIGSVEVFAYGTALKYPQPANE